MDKSSKLWAVGIGVVLWLGGARAQIDVDGLVGIGTGTIGVETIFTKNIWGAATDETQVMSDIKTLGDRRLYPVERFVLGQVLTSDAGGQKNLEALGEEFLTARLDTLMKQGLFEEVLAVAGRVPAELQSPTVKQRYATALWGLGRVNEACADPLAAAFGPNEAFVRAACAAETEPEETAALAFDVYRESGAERHTCFDAAGAVIYHQQTESVKLGEECSLWEVLLAARAGKEQNLTRRGQWRTLALNKKTAGAVRLSAAEKASLSAQDWLTVLDEVSDTSAQQVGLGKRAALYHRAITAKTETDKQAVVAAYLESAVTDKVLFEVAPVAEVLLHGMKPFGGAEVAESAVLTFALAGEGEPMHTWLGWWCTQEPDRCLKAAVLRDVFGQALPEDMTPLLSVCQREQSCATDLQALPFYLPFRKEKVFDELAEVPAGYPPFVAYGLAEKIKTGAIAEGFLRTLVLLSQTKNTDRTLVENWGQTLPEEIQRAVLVEQLVRRRGQIR